MEMNNKGISNQSMEVDPQGQPNKSNEYQFLFSSRNYCISASEFGKENKINTCISIYFFFLNGQKQTLNHVSTVLMPFFKQTLNHISIVLMPFYKQCNYCSLLDLGMKSPLSGDKDITFYNNFNIIPNSQEVERGFLLPQKICVKQTLLGCRYQQCKLSLNNSSCLIPGF